ncbi:GNAT family N-acetyltransferase [Aquamicrobium sp. LC103]|uniref:GNAT family N-acetyltransferase n=1 Tax=Aquamicrobium sp. LC103 TaxID=1120658 RepID=UPI00063EB2BE|nr:GNAT family N-acetyltransferase [Aquamicrobium sp. LC103]TKT74868.1 GNAT family N-acetyltransferase [Aquamicrobium sp. LC103]
MKLPFFSGAREFIIEMLEEADAPDLARIHKEDFLRPWTRGEFETLIGQDPVFGFVAREVGRPEAGAAGFVLARLAAGEAEILTIAVLRSHRRLGLGRDLMEAVLRELHAQRAEALFLEVDETNAPAIALYRRLGFREVGKRPAYYEAEGAGKSTALVMRRDLR